MCNIIAGGLRVWGFDKFPWIGAERQQTRSEIWSF
jgi:hypothetical protein